MSSSQGANFGAAIPPPLGKPRFDATLNMFCSRRNTKLDNNSFVVDNRPLDPHRLHVEVLKEGGMLKIDQQDTWDIIGGRLGFVQFPGSESEPAKSGPEVAQQLAQMYKEHLALFDQWYITQVNALENNKRMGANANFQPQ